jgi:hypothetical protein
MALIERPKLSVVQRGQDEPRLDEPTRWYQRRRLFVIVGLAVAILAVFWAGQRAEQGVRDNIDARLQDAGAGTDAGIVTLEAEQLSALRAITFTRGVGTALAANDPKTLNRLVTPLQANSGIPMVDIVQPDGRVLLAVRSKGAPAPVALRAGMQSISASLSTATGTRGGRLTLLAILRTGPALVTSGPIVSGTKSVGVALVMTPLADALGRLAQQVGVDLTAYDANGNPIATTAPHAPSPVDRTTARALVGGGAIEARELPGGRREALGRLVVDHTPVAVLGTSMLDNSPVTGHAVKLYAALGLIGTVIVLVSLWARVGSLWRWST